MGKKFGTSFSWKRAFGVSSAKARFARATGIPTTRRGRQRKAGAAMGCMIPIVVVIGVIFLCGLNENKILTRRTKNAMQEMPELLISR